MEHFIKGINKISERFLNIDKSKVVRKSLSEIIDTKNNYQKFEDENGHIFKVISGLRDYLKPYWRTMLIPPQFTVPNIIRANEIFENAVNSAKTALKSLSLIGVNKLKNAKAIEVGCYDGSRSVALRYLGILEVIGTDIIEYFIDSSIKNVGLDKLVENYRKYFYSLRMKYIENYLLQKPSKKINSDYNIKNINNISFLYDDIVNSKLPSEEFDLLFSWECLEHFINPKKAILNMSRILKPGGYAYHSYNPFFALNGGHSLCTLDIPWGHALLSEEGFTKYLREYRPNELELSKSFYLKCLNRLTLNDLKNYAKEANFETIILIPFPNFEHLKVLNFPIMKRVKELYPTVDLLELISPWITIIHKKL